MGSPDPCDPHCAFCRCAQPQHWVDIKRFEISKYPVTFDQWEACFEDGGCARRIAFADRWTGRNLPATSMNWQTVRDYIGWINKKTGKQYRLPSEAEWEYAARAGTTTKYYWGNEVGSGHASCPGCGSRRDDKSTSSVGSFAPNAFGLYDMAGNVWQWLEDCDNSDYKGSPTDGSAWTTGNCRSRVIRGGSWRDKTVGTADRRTEEIQYGPDNVGFRIARTLE
jgi:formylglycine-generating enzyme required for sulfatase activity